MSPTNIPVVKVRPGSAVSQVAAQAGLKLNYARLFDNSSIAIESPVQIRYDDPEHAFDLPPARFVWLPQRAGVVTGVEATPVLAYADLESAHKVALLVQERLSEAHWTPVSSFPKDLASAQRAFAKQPPGEEMSRIYSKWQVGPTTAEVYVKRHADTQAKAAGRAPTELYLPSVDIMDWALVKELDEKVFSRRRAVSGSINKSLPLSVWMNDQR